MSQLRFAKIQLAVQFLFKTLLGFGLFLSTAQADDLYQRQNGLWANPNCESPENFFYSQVDTYLAINKNDGAWVGKIVNAITHRVTETHMIELVKYGDELAYSWGWFEGDLLLSANGPSFPINGNLDTSKIASAADIPPPDVQKTVYKKCEKLPSQLYLQHAEGIKAVQLIAGIKENCQIENGKCGPFILSFFDVSGNGKLSVAEVSRAIRIATYASIAATPDGANEKSLAWTFLATNLIGPFIAKSMIEGSDYDGDGQLSVDEILYDRENATLEASLGKVSIDGIGASLGSMLSGLSKLGKFF